MDRDLKRALSDRVYDKRKLAALDLEQLIRDCLVKGDKEKIQAVITELSQDFAYAVRHPNYRNGGLIGLAAVSIALGHNELAYYLDDIMPPVLSCFGDADPRVRYYACESLYNVAKVAKGELLQYFNELFDVLCKLVADPEESVRNGADLVDRLLKDIVAEKAATYVFLVSQHAPEIPPAITETDGAQPAYQAAPPQAANSFSLQNFIPVLVERIYVMNPATRMFLVQWIVLLDSIPDLELVSYVPAFLEGFMQFLSDSHKEVRVATKAALSGFLREIKAISQLKEQGTPNPETQAALPDTANTSIVSAADTSLADTSLGTGLYVVGQDVFIDYPRITAILLECLDSSHEEIRFVALEWLKAFLTVSPGDVTADIPRLAGVLLPILSDPNPEIREAGTNMNESILSLTQTQKDLRMDYGATVNALTLQFLNEEEVTRLAALDWLVKLQRFASQEPNNSTLQTLLKLLGDPSDLVVAKDVQLVAEVLHAANDDTFQALLGKVIDHFKSNRQLLKERGRYVLSRLCEILNPERVYRSLALILRKEPDKDFACLMVQDANNNLLTSPQLKSLRATLRQLETKEGANLFVILFESWSCNAVAALSLCLLAQAYQHAVDVLQIIAHSDISVGTLVQIDRLVQLIESPVFTSLRLQLLEPQTHHHLYRCLYGLLMVLPQSSAFTTLQTRLSSVVAMASLPPPCSTASTVSRDIDWSKLLQEFRRAQLD